MESIQRAITCDYLVMMRIGKTRQHACLLYNYGKPLKSQGKGECCTAAEPIETNICQRHYVDEIIRDFAILNLEIVFLYLNRWNDFEHRLFNIIEGQAYFVLH